MRTVLIALAVAAAAVSPSPITAQEAPTSVSATVAAGPAFLTPKATAEDELRLQLVLLKTQLAQALATAASCEVNGPQSQKTAADASAAAQTLVRDLDARGLMVDPSTNAIVAKPAASGGAPPVK